MGRQLLSRVAVVAAISTAFLGIPAVTASAAPTASSPITYVYDEIGRLEAVVDPAATNGIAKYAYDDVGNLTSITRAATTNTTILDFHAHSGAVGDKVTIYGAGFSSTPSQDTVKFGGSSGTTATVTSAGTTILTVTVPSGAPTGAIYVKNTATNKAATSGQTFSVNASLAPTITSVTASGQIGTSVTINGTNFSTDPRSNVVTFNRSRATVTNVTVTNGKGTALAVTVPSGAGTGRIRVRTADGSATSAQDFLVTPIPGAPSGAGIESTGRMNYGDSSSYTLNTLHDIAIRTFTASKGDWITLAFSNLQGYSVGLPYSDVFVLDPFGRVVQGTSVCCWYNPPFIEAHNLPFDGDYTIVVVYSYAGGSTPPVSGTLTLYNSSPITGPNVVPTTAGTNVTLTATVPGQQAIFTFDANESDHVQIKITGGTAGFSGGRFYAPSDPFLEGGYDLGDTIYILPAGHYTVYLDPGDGGFPSETGSITVTLTLEGTGLAATGSVQTRRVSARALPEAPPTTGSPREPLDLTVIETLATATDFGPERWTPPHHDRENWSTGRPTSPMERVPLLSAPKGATALAGQVLKLNGAPMPGAAISLGATTTSTDVAGRFLLENVQPGHGVLTVDGRPVDKAAYGVFEISVDVDAHKTNELPAVVWMPRLDAEDAVSVPTHITEPLTITNPSMPGFEVRIPRGSRIVDDAGNPVTRISLTPVPLDRTPFPTPALNTFTMHFTLQPGDAHIEGRGFRLIYPNYTHLVPGSAGQLWQYEPDEEGWDAYGTATVSADGQQIVPGARARVHDFAGASVSAIIASLFFGSCTSAGAEDSSTSTSGSGGTAGQQNCSSDPVDVASGQFDYSTTDLSEPGPMPLELQRLYAPNDSFSYAFGLGFAMRYEMRIASTNQNCGIDFVVPGRAPVHFAPAQSCGGLPMTSTTPGIFAGAKLISTSPYPYEIERRDGVRYFFNFGGGLGVMEDRFGNSITADYGSNPSNSRILSLLAYPSGRWITLSYSGLNGTATSASDALGRTVSYTYENPAPNLYRLKTFTDAEQSTKQAPVPVQYGWDPSTTVSANGSTNPSAATYLESITDSRGNVILQNHFTSQGKIDVQTIATGGTYRFDYNSTDPACAGGTKVTDPNSNVSCAVIGSTGLVSARTEAVGTGDQRTFTYHRDPTTGQLQSIDDSFHTRTTSFTYDVLGNLKTVTKLPGTPQAVTTTYAYEPAFNQLTLLDDPLHHDTMLDYTAGCLTKITDALANETTMTCTGSGQTASVTYPGTGGSRTTNFGYSFGDLVTVTDPLNRATARFVDTGGRLLAATDALEYRTKYAYDLLGNLTSVTDARNKTTSFLYDADSNLTRVTDALTHQTNFAYFPSNLLQTRTDALNHSESFSYDPKGNLTLHTDRKGQVTEYRYNAFDAPTFIGYNRTGTPGNYSYESTVNLGYDGGWRLASIADSTPGVSTITRGYDDLDRLTSDSQPQGTVSYTYFDDGRRKTMTAGNQAVTNYAWFPNGLIQQISRGSAQVAFSYRPDGLPATTTLAGGQVETNSYDAAQQLTGIAYTGIPTAGQLTYGYDQDGRRTAVWDSWARTGLPTAVAANQITYNADNQLTKWANTNASYNLNGSLTAYGSLTYTWNARNQLTATSGGTSSFLYDGLGRRIKTVVSGTTTRYLYDGANVAQEQNNGGTPTADLLTGLGLDQTYQRTVSGTSYNYLADALGSTVALVAGSTVSPEYTYEPYGASTQTGTIANPYRFTGREWDGATGLQFNRARYYNPTWGRFISEDPVWVLGAFSDAYSYGLDNPTTLVDPSGLWVGGSGFWSQLFSAVSVLAGGTALLLTLGGLAPTAVLVLGIVSVAASFASTVATCIGTGVGAQCTASGVGTIASALTFSAGVSAESAIVRSAAGLLGYLITLIFQRLQQQVAY